VEVDSDNAGAISIENEDFCEELLLRWNLAGEVGDCWGSTQTINGEIRLEVICSQFYVFFVRRVNNPKNFTIEYRCQSLHVQ
jgi:hypothetical protein